MAELKVQVQVAKQNALKDIQTIQDKLDALEKNPAQIKFDVQGLDAVSTELTQTVEANKQLAESAKKATDAFNKLKTPVTGSGVRQHKEDVDQLNNAYNRLGVTVANFAKYRFFNALTTGIRDSISEMKKLDDELVTVRKVADATEYELERIERRSYEVGSKYGKAPSAYAGGVAEFSRAGYRETADSLAELSIKSQLVGDMSGVVANQFLIATDAAYQYNGSTEKPSAVLDGMNAIDNNFATSIEKMSAGLGKVAPIASQAHVGVDELTAALGTITAVTQRSGEEAATALRALFLNIMGDTKTEIEDGAKWTAGEIDGLRDILEKYAPAAVAAAEATGQVINPMEAMRGLAQSIKDGVLSEQELMQMVTDIGGKLRSSQLLAIVQNWDMYEAMLGKYQTAAGSADAEISKMMDSWSVKAQQLETAFTKMLSGLVDSKTAKGALDFLRGMVELLDTDFGRVVVTAAGAASAFVGIRKAVEMAGKALGAFRADFLWISAAVAVVGALSAAFSELFPNMEKLQERAEESRAAYEQEQASLASIETELGNVGAQIDALNAKEKLTLVEQAELDKLTQMRTELEYARELQEQVLVLKQQEAAYAAARVLGAYSQYDENAIRDYREMNELPSYIVGLLTETNDVNALIVAYQALEETKAAVYETGDTDKISDHNELLARSKELLLQLTNEYQTFISDYRSLYKTVLDKSPIEWTSDENAFVAMMRQSEQTVRAVRLMTDEAGYYSQIQNAIVQRASKMEGGLTAENLEAAAYAYTQASMASVEYKADIDKVTQSLLEQVDESGKLSDSYLQLAEAEGQTAKAAGELAGQDPAPELAGLSAFDRLLKEAQNDLNSLKKSLSEQGESGDLFREYRDIFGELTGLQDSGRTGTKAYRAYLEAIFNEETLAQLGGDIEKIGQKLNDQLIAGMLDPEKSGEELAAFMADNYKGVGAAFKRVGDQISVTVSDWDAFSQSTGLATEVLQALFGYMTEWDNNLAQTASQTKETAEANKELAKSVDEVATAEKEASTAEKQTDTGKTSGETSEVEKLQAEIEELRKAAKTPVAVQTDTEAAVKAVDELTEKTASLTKETHTVAFEADTDAAIRDVVALAKAVQALEGIHTVQFAVVGASTAASMIGGAATGSASAGLTTGLNRVAAKNAAGTDSASAGPSVVNELGPELIVSRGGAYIAGDGRPTIVDLHEGDIVYNHLETEAMLAGRSIGPNGIASHAMGTKAAVKAQVLADKLLGSPELKLDAPSKSKKKSGSGGGGSGGGSSGDEEETDWWAIVEDWFGYYTDQNQRAIDRLGYQIELLENGLDDLTKPLEKQIDQIERLNDQLDRQMELLERQQEALVKPIQDEIDSLKKAKDIQDEQLELTERQKAVEEARNELQNAQNERTIRYFNEQKGQWEWMADKGAVDSAQRALEDAEKSLADYEYDMYIRALERQIEQIEDVYDAKLGELEEQQTANDDLIYDLEQQILAAEDAYNAAIEPLEAQMTELERKLRAIEEAWAEAEAPYGEPEEKLSEALDNIEGSKEEIAAVKAALDAAKSAGASGLNQTANAGVKKVAVAHSGTTQSMQGQLIAEMGLLFGASGGKTDTSSYSTSSVSTVYDYSGAITIGGITITGDPSTMTLAELIDDIGIYVQR